MSPILFPILGDALRTVLERVLPPDPELRAKAEAELRAMERDGSFEQRAELASRLAQLDINKAEASTDAYRGGWRPFVGWSCGLAVAFEFIAKPATLTVCAIVGHPVPPLPTIEPVLMELLGIMLGTAGLRTIEKLKGRQ